MENKIAKIEQRQQRIEEKLDQIILMLETINSSCGAMDNHISFVENVYSVVRAPLDLTLSVLSPFASRDAENTLPNFRQNTLQNGE
ncbi:MAG: hypothetical protein V3W20_09455 [Candidatus Neomarinimicrobiota bacterium]